MREVRAAAAVAAVVAEADGEAGVDARGRGFRVRAARAVRGLRSRRRLLGDALAERLEERVARPSSRAALSASSHSSAIASGGKVNPDTSARTSWLAFSDQFHSR